MYDLECSLDLEPNLDRKFLSKLDEKLRISYRVRMTPNLSGDPINSDLDTYSDSQLYRRELKRALKIVNEYNLVFAPVNTGMGFLVGFQIVDPETKKVLLKFVERQLPSVYDFNRLSQYFMDPKNLKRAEQIGIDIRNNREHYDY